MNSSSFSYLSGRIRSAEFQDDPFPHLEICPFFNEEHLKILTEHRQLLLRPFKHHRALINHLLFHGYAVQQFPGCAANVNVYMKQIKTGLWIKGTTTDTSSLGLALRLTKYKSPELKALVQYCNGDEFHEALRDKFNVAVDTETSIVSAIQKYLTGYEISPHPDVRRKCLTYMCNLHTDPRAEALDIHTKLHRFKPEFEHVSEIWEKLPRTERDWMPWNTAEPVKTLRRNNSMVMFRATNHSLHSIKLDYDHLPFQRTQLYGNLLYANSQ